MTTRTLMIIAAAIALMAGAAYADSIPGQRDAELAFCNKNSSTEMYDCLKANRWLPGTGRGRVLPPDFVASITRAADAVRSNWDASMRCGASSGLNRAGQHLDTEDADSRAGYLKANRDYLACLADEEAKAK